MVVANTVKMEVMVDGRSGVGSDGGSGGNRVVRKQGYRRRRWWKYNNGGWR
jgi:hypothetical protein